MIKSVNGGIVSAKIFKCILPAIILTGFMLYFAYDIFTLKKCFTIPDYLSYYYPYRQWFSQQLLNGNFPVWNPFWGLGHVAEICSTFPVDIYTILEIVFGPQYHYFQTIQFALILLAGFYAFLKLGFNPMVSAAGIILYFLMPWVTYWYYFFWVAHAFIGNMLLFVFVYLLFKTENYKYLFFIIWTVIFSMFGTKPEFWFFNIMLYVFYSLAAALLFYSRKFLHSIKIFSLAILSMIIGILAHSWQLNILTRVMNLSGRRGDSSIFNLFSSEMYHNLFSSIAESSLLKMLGVGFLFYLGIDTKRQFSRVFLLFGLIALFWLKIWRFDEIVSFIKSPVLIGAVLGVSLYLLRGGFLGLINSIKNYHIVTKFLRNQVKTGLLFLLFIYYWCRPPSSEMGVMNLAPFAFKILLGALVWLGCTQFWRNKLAKLAYFSVLFVFLLREHGQILFAYLTGLIWIPTRDSYTVDFTIAVLAVIGLSTLDMYNRFAFRRKWWSLVSPASLISIGVIVFSASSNFYYSQPRMENPPADYLYYFTSPSKVRKAIHELRDSSTARIFIVNKPTISFTFGFDACLQEGVSQITQYAGLVSKNYVDWALYKRLGIKPRGKWAGAWTGGISEKITPRLPQKDTHGCFSIDLYILSVIVRPPIEKDVLKLLGVKYILVFTKSLSDPTVGYYDLKSFKYLNEKIKDLDLKDVKDSDGFFYTARLDDPLPRAFLVNGVSQESISEFMNEMSPIIGDNNAIIKTKSFEFPLDTSASIEKYEPESVSVTVEAKEDAYLVLSDLYHPFWHAKLDGKNVDIIPAFYVLRAVKVPPGKHHIEFYCKVPYFKTSMVISLLIILLSIVTFFIRIRYRRFQY